MAGIQEFFSSNNNVEELETILKKCGFSRVDSWKTPTYEIPGKYSVFVNIQEIKGATHVAANSGNKIGFVMELDCSLYKYSKKHPLFSFFRSLNNPKAHGMTTPPRYSIDKYLQR